MKPKVGMLVHPKQALYTGKLMYEPFAPYVFTITEVTKKTFKLDAHDPLPIETFKEYFRILTEDEVIRQ